MTRLDTNPSQRKQVSVRTFLCCQSRRLVRACASSQTREEAFPVETSPRECDVSFSVFVQPSTCLFIPSNAVLHGESYHTQPQSLHARCVEPVGSVAGHWDALLLTLRVAGERGARTAQAVVRFESALLDVNLFSAAAAHKEKTGGVVVREIGAGSVTDAIDAGSWPV